jgi:hypothetical protein
MPWVGFEPMTPPFERAKTVHALDREATVIGKNKIDQPGRSLLRSKSVILLVDSLYAEAIEAVKSHYRPLYPAVLPFVALRGVTYSIAAFPFIVP